MKSTEKPAKCTEKPAGIPKFRNFEFENSFRSKLPENREISAGISFPVVTEIFFKNENVNPGEGTSALGPWGPGAVSPGRGGTAAAGGRGRRAERRCRVAVVGAARPVPHVVGKRSGAADECDAADCF